jgi:hypothetical protein
VSGAQAQTGVHFVGEAPDIEKAVNGSRARAALPRAKDKSTI